MGYEMNERKIPWATKRVDQVKAAELEVGAALEALEKVPKGLRAGADLMDDQPDSDMVRSFANDLEKTAYELRHVLEGMVRDCKDIEKALAEYERSKKNDC